jgi:hypothetical protein
MRKKSLLFCLLPLMAGCSLFYQKDKGEPAYVHIPAIELVTNSAQEGTNSQNIRDVWVFVDGNVQGVYPLPTTFPILREGNVTFKLNAGIAVNGISATRAIYPFYRQYDTTLNLVRGKTDTIRPVVTYNAQITFGYLEDFESQGFSLRTTSQSDTTFLPRQSLAPGEAFEGVGSLGFAVDTRAPRFMCETIQAFNFPGGGGRAVFLELNYRNNIPFDIGLQIIEADGQFIDQPLVTLAPSSDVWRKQYINFTPFIQGRSGVTYRLLIYGNHPGGAETSRVFIDNLKLLW